MSLRNICFEQIKDTFFYGQFGEFKLVIDKETGFFNATKLCKQGNKEYRFWFRLERTKSLIQSISDGCDNTQINFSYEKKTAQQSEEDKIISGTYIHEGLLDDIIHWMRIGQPIQPKSGLVYIITNDNLEKHNIYKIGYTNNLDRRLKQFNEYRLEGYEPVFRLLDTYLTDNAKNLEFSIHSKLKEYRINNTEFFKLELDKIKHCCEEENKIN